ncbi:tRNA (adenosine(37)-N6)-threonylcarbamoyltransferase complex transferase subunit TsaD [Candidatus Calescamantes bacterium]|nr:tRNA (adenosine(37)-N6)-threonylcarbamoyltransferase complex transferase subunit TsaD [Candidatus Calescamantes bacterium]
MASIFLGIDTSCDDTCCGVVKEGRKVLSSVVSSQEEIHSKFGGVVPEYASRAHVERIGWVVKTALDKSGLSWEEVEGIGVTRGPGLPGSLLVGWEFAKGLSLSAGIPLIPINHLEAHLFAPFLDFEGEVDFPLLGMVVSGGHTLLAYSPTPYDFYLLGQTRDDACGEALDKVARLLGLPYPGGPHLEKLAEKGNASRIDFPKKILPQSYDFSFSGLKTHAVRIFQSGKYKVEDLAASFQEAVMDILVDKLDYAVETLKVGTVVVGGGVVANKRLRKKLDEFSRERKIPLLYPKVSYSLDNGAMIAGLAYFKYLKGIEFSWREDIDPSFNLERWER